MLRAQQPIQVQGRLQDPAEFADVVIKTDGNGAITRIRDIARVELGSQDYGIRGYFDGKRGIGLLSFTVGNPPERNAIPRCACLVEWQGAARPDRGKNLRTRISGARKPR